jgi:flagellar hook-associated protein 3 FlgL
MSNGDLQGHLRLQEYKLNRVTNQLGTQQRLTRLAEDPIAAGHLVRYGSYLSRINQFEENAKKINDKLSMAEGYVNASLEIVQRVRELSVQAANGTYTAEDLKVMAAETDQLLQELVQNANAIGPDGALLFAGSHTRGSAFDVELGGRPGSPTPVITAVHYNGNVDSDKIEVDETEFLHYSHSGDRIFWAESQRLFSDRDSSAYQVRADGTISVAGVQVKLKAGDNSAAIAAKINDSGAAVRASIDQATQGLNLETTDARQLWLQDLDGTTLFDLGLINDATQRPPYNISPGAGVTGSSLFDVIIGLRDAMFSGDQEAIGGRILGKLDQGLGNLTARLSELGAASERAAFNARRNTMTAYNTETRIAREGDVDMSQAITDMKMLEYVQQATMSTAARLYSHSLLNYMR